MGHKKICARSALLLCLQKFVIGQFVNWSIRQLVNSSIGQLVNWFIDN